MANSIKQLILHAPNIHSGGGGVLLRSILAVNDIPVRWVQLDERSRDSCQLPQCTVKHFVRRSIFSRIFAEWRLHRTATTNDLVLCFHGLPPLFPTRAKVVVFIQNRLLIEQSSLAAYPLNIRLRLAVERLWCRLFQRRCSRYIVQTPSMAESLTCWLRSEIPVSVLPFAPATLASSTSKTAATRWQYDFVYIASGEAHKNHDNLLLAWRLLAEVGLKPSLALTVDALNYPRLASEIERQRDHHGLNIVNLGKVASADIPALYKSSSALIFPSKVESFGLPLIEATQMGLPVLASELDYVRDVIEPVETFDPESPVSMARAVRRFLKNPEPVGQIGTAEEFLAEVLR